jgi:mono/diheme cytochrome c family protein
MVRAAAQSGIDRPEITSGDVRDLIAYLYTLNYFNEPGDFGEGRRSFWEKGCGTCHSVRGEGKSVGPALRKGSPVYMSWAMWNHGTGMTREMADRGIQTPTFDRKSMADLLAYIRGRRVEGWPESGSGIPGNAKTGRNLFVARGCQRCHAIDGRVYAEKADPLA